MTLVTLNDVLPQAQKGKYAVGAFNYTDLNTARGIVEAAEEKNSPVVLQIAESHFPYLPLEQGANVALDLAKHAKVPVVVHLDHGTDIKTCMQALRLGFSSVMLDFSTKSFEENIEGTKMVVEAAHDMGATVEGEIGVMTRDEGEGKPEYDKLTDNYTKVDDAVKFAKETGIDAMAISYGTVHGIYREKPNLNFDRLKEIREAVDVPLVVHGASGLTHEEYRKSVENGISKINYYSVMSNNVIKGLTGYLNDNKDKQVFLYDADMQIKDLVKKDLKDKIEVFGSANKA